MTAVAQTNLKKLLAYSTIANCNLMTLIAIVGSTEVLVGFFLTHAIAKSLLFLLVGEMFKDANHSQAIQNIRSRTGMYYYPMLIICIGLFLAYAPVA
jgi:NADH:ubiquinone oxidoreductase subunit 5 (subunit L)/multisubunit Na+/H+ antiporter MnhA subunit